MDILTLDKIKETVLKIKNNKPVILNLTNYVTMDFVANCLLAIGAAPIMSVSRAELEELIFISSSININIGTLDENFIEKLYFVEEFAKKYNKPIVLDPVGAGATKIRTKTAQNLIQNASIVRGNASEIIALHNSTYTTRGVESANSVSDAEYAATDLASKNNNTVVVSGAIDYVTDGIKKCNVAYGSEIMSFVTGMGCALSAVLAAFLAVQDSPYEASVLGTHYFALCGTLASDLSKYPGTFKNHMIDYLYKLDATKMHDLI